MKKQFAFAFFGLLVGLSAHTAIAAEKLILAGSATVQKRVLEPAAQLVEEKTGIELVVQGINSGKGFQKLMKDEIVASISSSPLKLLLEKNKLPDDGTYQEHILYKDIIVPVVHKSNPVTELTWQQLSDVNTGKITNWKELGGSDQKIVVVTSDPNAATRIVFNKLIMNKQPYVKGAREVKATHLQMDLVSKYRGGIGTVSAGLVADYSGKINIVKTEEISRPLSIITKGKPQPLVQKLIDFLQTPEARQTFH